MLTQLSEWPAVTPTVGLSPALLTTHYGHYSHVDWFHEWNSSWITQRCRDLQK